jgi:hypothetical protein
MDTQSREYTEHTANVWRLNDERNKKLIGDTKSSEYDSMPFLDRVAVAYRDFQ